MIQIHPLPLVCLPKAMRQVGTKANGRSNKQLRNFNKTNNLLTVLTNTTNRERNQRNTRANRFMTRRKKKPLFVIHDQRKKTDYFPN